MGHGTVGLLAKYTSTVSVCRQGGAQWEACSPHLIGGVEYRTPADRCRLQVSMHRHIGVQYDLVPSIQTKIA